MKWFMIFVMFFMVACSGTVSDKTVAEQIQESGSAPLRAIEQAKAVK